MYFSEITCDPMIVFYQVVQPVYLIL